MLELDFGQEKNTHTKCGFPLFGSGCTTIIAFADFETTSQTEKERGEKEVN